MNEDQIIAQAFLSIRQGIITGDWNFVCQAYEAISGEKLEPPRQKPKSRLEAIREQMGLDTVESDEETEETQSEGSIIDISLMSPAQLKELLLKKGYKNSDFKGKKREDLLELLLKPSPLEPDVKSIQETEIQGGKRFGLGKVKIISDQFDPIEAEANKRAARTKMPPVKRSTMPTDNSDDESSDFRFHKNPPAPPWK
jgi:hypothetical protein